MSTTLLVAPPNFLTFRHPCYERRAEFLGSSLCRRHVWVALATSVAWKWPNQSLSLSVLSYVPVTISAILPYFVPKSLLIFTAASTGGTGGEAVAALSQLNSSSQITRKNWPFTNTDRSFCYVSFDNIVFLFSVGHNLPLFSFCVCTLRFFKYILFNLSIPVVVFGNSLIC